MHAPATTNDDPNFGPWKRFLEFVVRPRLKLSHLLLAISAISVPLAWLGAEYRKLIRNERVEAYVAIMRFDQLHRFSAPKTQHFVETRLHLQECCDADLIHLTQFSNLESLELYSRKCTDKALREVCRLDGLKKLTLFVPSLTTAGLVDISNLSRLEELTITGGDGIDETVLEKIARIGSLRSINLLRGEVTGDGVEHLSKLPQLRHLQLSGKQLTDKSLAGLQNLHQLESLSLSGNQLTDNTLKHLRNLQSLKVLSLSEYERSYSNLQEPKITVAGISYLHGLSRLQSIEISGMGITDECFKSIGEIDSIERLAIGSYGITGSGLGALCSLPKLRELVISSEIRGEYLGELIHCSSLETLQFRDHPRSKVPAIRENLNPVGIPTS